MELQCLEWFPVMQLISRCNWSWTLQAMASDATWSHFPLREENYNILSQCVGSLSCECTEKRLSTFTRVLINKHGSFVLTLEGCAGLQVCLAFWWLWVQKKRGINANHCFVADFFTCSLYSPSFCGGTEILFPVGKKTSLTRSMIVKAGMLILVTCTYKMTDKLKQAVEPNCFPCIKAPQCPNPHW